MDQQPGRSTASSYSDAKLQLRQAAKHFLETKDPRYIKEFHRAAMLMLLLQPERGKEVVRLATALLPPPEPASSTKPKKEAIH